MSPRNVLVTGGAGYIGSIVTERLLDRGHRVTVVDNLSTGHREAVHPDAQFLQLDLCAPEQARTALFQSGADAVIHLAAKSLVGESMQDPGLYFHANSVGGLNLLRAMQQEGVRDIIFSSTAAVYGTPRSTPIRETDPTDPINPYGASKLSIEIMLRWFRECHGIRPVALRYFNAAGASKERGEHHDPETHLIPITLQTALGQRPHLTIFGDDYETHDGTCVRDYVHVEDLADAHIAVLDSIESTAGRAFNVGIGHGYSVAQVVDAARRVTNTSLPVQVGERRAGDPAVLVASSDALQEATGWRPRRPEIEDIVESAWAWMRPRPQGYSTPVRRHKVAPQRIVART